MFKQILLCVLLSCFVSTTCLAQTRTLSSSEIKWLRSEIKQAQTVFVQDVSKETGVSEAIIWEWMPKNPAQVDPNFRIFSALQKTLPRPLTNRQKSNIRTIDQQKKNAINTARKQLGL